MSDIKIILLKAQVNVADRLTLVQQGQMVMIELNGIAVDGYRWNIGAMEHAAAAFRRLANEQQ